MLQTWIIAAVYGTAMTLALVFGVRTPTTIVVQTPTTQADAFDQRAFPCQEDQALMYARDFGPDRVGCVYIDDLRDGD